MDVILGVVVIGAVIFFGALISAGNERQRVAIDGIRQQAERWAMEDLRLKRGKVAHEVKMDNPLAWLNEATSRVLGEQVQLAAQEIFQGPLVVACHDDLNGRALVFSATLPDQVRKLGRQRRSKLAEFSDRHPLIPWQKGTLAMEMNMLNAGVIFDLEMPKAWKMLTGQETPSERLWLYVLPE